MNREVGDLYPVPGSLQSNLGNNNATGEDNPPIIPKSL